jgi:hypothetical protein
VIIKRWEGKNIEILFKEEKVSERKEKLWK